MVWATSHKLCAVLVASVLATGPAMAERVEVSATEFPRETQALVAATVSLFEAAEAQSRSGGMDTLPLSPVASPISAETGSETGTAFDTDRPVRHLTGYRITWYPVDTLLGAVDFMGTWDNARNLVCGYVTWDLSNPDAPEMRALVANYVDISGLAEADRTAQESALLDANCAFGEIDSNYAALN